MQHKWIMASIAFILISSLWAAPIDDFRQAFMANQSNPEVLDRLIADFKDQKLVLEDHRLFQSLWNYVDPQGMQEHYDELLRQNPQNPEFIYLSIRTQETPVQLIAARKLIQDFPTFYWGYRVIAVNLTEELTQDGSQAYLESLEYKNDLSLVKQGLKRFGGDAYLNIALFYALKDTQDYRLAAAALDKVSDPQAISSNMQQIEEFTLKIHDLDLYTRLVSTVMDEAQETGRMTAAESEINAQYYIMNFIVADQGIGALDEYLAENSFLMDNADLSRVIAILYLEHERVDSALNALEAYATSDDVDYMSLTRSQEFTALESHPRWQGVLNKAKVNWDKGADFRKAEALKDRGYQPAPSWEMQDLQGKTQKLKDLKGKIVILDFWASWCGPCKMAMPALSTWMQEKMPKGVEVFSVNVMERDLQDGRDYFLGKDFKMIYLEGTPEIAKAYGVEGIPHFTIIDQAGNIAWQHVGFSYSFDETLNFQIEALKRK